MAIASKPFSALTLALAGSLLLTPPIWAQPTSTVGPQYVVQRADTPARITRAMGIAPHAWKNVLAYNHTAQRKALVPGTVLKTPLQHLRYTSASARLVQTAGDVKVNGISAQAGVYLQERSQITTGANSSARVLLADGSTVQLQPLTTLELNIVRQYQAPAPQRASTGMIDWFAEKLRLVQGSIEAQVKPKMPRATPLEVETSTSMIGVRGTTFRVSTADADAAFDRAEVLNGLVQSTNLAQKTSVALPKGTGAAVNPQEAKMQAVQLLPAVQIAQDGTTLQAPSNSQLNFTPLSNHPTQQYRVIAAADNNFDAVLLSKRFTGSSVDLSELSPGTWFVAIRAIDSFGLEGFDAITRITVLEAKRPRPGLAVHSSEEQYQSM